MKLDFGPPVTSPLEPEDSMQRQCVLWGGRLALSLQERLGGTVEGSGEGCSAARWWKKGTGDK